MTNGRRALVAAVATGVLGVGGLATMSTVASAGGPPVPASCQVTTYAYELTHLDGSVEYTTRIRGTGDASPVQPGDQITVMFDVRGSLPRGRRAVDRLVPYGRGRVRPPPRSRSCGRAPPASSSPAPTP